MISNDRVKRICRIEQRIFINVKIVFLLLRCIRAKQFRLKIDLDFHWSNFDWYFEIVLKDSPQRCLLRRIIQSSLLTIGGQSPRRGDGEDFISVVEMDLSRMVAGGNNQFVGRERNIYMKRYRVLACDFCFPFSLQPTFAKDRELFVVSELEKSETISARYLVCLRPLLFSVVWIDDFVLLLLRERSSTCVCYLLGSVVP